MRVCHSSSRFLRLCFVLVWLVKEACSSKSWDPNSVTYFLAKPAENCSSACVTRGMSCVKRDAFPNDSLYIFRSINVSCLTGFDTDRYTYPDQPNLILQGMWKGRCTGFHYPNRTTDCGRGGNLSARRLCPCQYIPTNSPILPTTKTNTTVATLSTATTTNIVKTSTRAKTKTEKQATDIMETTTITAEERTRTALPTNTSPSNVVEKRLQTDEGTSLNTWQIIVILLVLLVICGIVVTLLVVYKRKREQGKPGPSRIISKRLPVNLNLGQVSQNPVYIDSMIDFSQTRTVARSRTESKDHLCEAIEDTYYSSPYSNNDAKSSNCYEEVNKLNSVGIDVYHNPHYEALDETASISKKRSESLNVLYQKVDDNKRSERCSTDNVLYDSSSKDNQLYERADNLEEKDVESNNPLYGSDAEASALYVENSIMEHSGMCPTVEGNPIYESKVTETYTMDSMTK